MSIRKSIGAHIHEKDEAIPSTSGCGKEICRDSKDSTIGSHHHEITSKYEEEDSSTPEYSTSSSEPQIQVSREVNEGDIESSARHIPTDYEIFLAKSQADYEKHRRDWVAIEIENESMGNKEPGDQKSNSRKALATIRTIARVVQVLIRFILSRGRSEFLVLWLWEW